MPGPEDNNKREYVTLSTSENMELLRSISTEELIKVWKDIRDTIERKNEYIIDNSSGVDNLEEYFKKDIDDINHLEQEYEIIDQILNDLQCGLGHEINDMIDRLETAEMEEENYNIYVKHLKEFREEYQLIQLGRDRKPYEKSSAEYEEKQINQEEDNELFEKVRIPEFEDNNEEVVATFYSTEKTIDILRRISTAEQIRIWRDIRDTIERKNEYINDNSSGVDNFEEYFKKDLDDINHFENKYHIIDQILNDLQDNLGHEINEIIDRLETVEMEEETYNQYVKHLKEINEEYQLIKLGRGEEPDEELSAEYEEEQINQEVDINKLEEQPQEDDVFIKKVELSPEDKNSKTSEILEKYEPDMETITEDGEEYIEELEDEVKEETYDEIAADDKVESVHENEVKYQQAPKNIGPYSIEDGAIPFEIKISSDPAKIAKFYSDNRTKLNEAERNYLVDLHNNAKYFAYLSDQKQYVQLKESKLVEENGTVLLPDITLNHYQDTNNGCWSCAFELLLQSKGIELDQKNIRSFRPNVNANIHIGSVEGLVEDKPFSIGETADLVLDVLPNTAVRRKKFTAYEINANVVQRLETELISSIKEVITKHHTPVALTNGSHFITVVGVDKKGNLLCKDSLGSKKYLDPNYTYEISLSKYINAAVDKTGYISFEMTHFEEVKLENEEIQNFKGTDLDSRIKYKDGKASLIGQKRQEAENVPYITNVNGMQIGSSKTVEDVMLIEDIAYLPNALTVIQPKPEKIKPFDIGDGKVFDEPFGIDYNKQSDVITEGNYQYGNFLALSKEERKEFLDEIHQAVISQSQIFISDAEKRPELKKVYDIAVEMLNNIESNLIECSTQGRISDKAIRSARNLMATVCIINYASQKGNEQAIKTISKVEKEYIFEAVDIIDNLNGIMRDYMVDKIQTVNSFGELVKNPIENSRELFKTNSLRRAMKNKFGGSAEYIPEEKPEPKPQVKQEQPVKEEKQVSVPINKVEPQPETKPQSQPVQEVPQVSVPINMVDNEPVQEEQMSGDISQCH